MSQYTLSNNTNSFNVSNYIVGDDRSRLLTWLSPLEPGLRHWASKSPVSTMLGNGSYRQRNSGDGAIWVGKAKAISQFYFATEIRGPAKHSLSNKTIPKGEKKVNPY